MELDVRLRPYTNIQQTDPVLATIVAAALCDKPTTRIAFVADPLERHQFTEHIDLSGRFQGIRNTLLECAELLVIALSMSEQLVKQSVDFANRCGFLLGHDDKCTRTISGGLTQECSPVITSKALSIQQ